MTFKIYKNNGQYIYEGQIADLLYTISYKMVLTQGSLPNCQNWKSNNTVNSNLFKKQHLQTYI